MEIQEKLFLICCIFQMFISIYLVNRSFGDLRDSKKNIYYFKFLTGFKIFESEDICSKYDTDDVIRKKLKDLTTATLYKKKEKMISALFLEKEILNEILKSDLNHFKDSLYREEEIFYMILDELEARSGSDKYEKNKKKQKNIRNFH